MKVKRYEEYFDYEQLAEEFCEAFESFIKESDSEKQNPEKTWKKIAKDLGLQMTFIGTFGTGITAFMPIVHSMMENMNISTELTYDKIVLLTVCSLSIIYLEEKKFKNAKEEEQLINDSKSMLEELRMMGLGNGIVKMVVKAIKSVTNLFNLIGKHIGKAVGGVIDMFGYTALMIPILNGLNYLIGKYNLTPETLKENLVGLAVGLGTIIAKHGIPYILRKLKGKFKFKKDDILDEIEDTPVIQNFSLYNKEDEEQGEPINEQ